MQQFINRYVALLEIDSFEISKISWIGGFKV